MKECHECLEPRSAERLEELFCKPEVVLECEKVVELKLKIFHLESELRKHKDVVEKSSKYMKVICGDKFENESLF